MKKRKSYRITSFSVCLSICISVGLSVKTHFVRNAWRCVYQILPWRCEKINRLWRITHILTLARNQVNLLKKFLRILSFLHYIFTLRFYNIYIICQTGLRNSIHATLHAAYRDTRRKEWRYNVANRKHWRQPSHYKRRRLLHYTC